MSQPSALIAAPTVRVPTPTVVAAPDILSVPAIEASLQSVEHYVSNLEAEIRALQAEVLVLRRRDETIKFNMTRFDEEMRLAARLQQDFLPKTLPQVGNVRFHALFRPAGYVSGDLYDVIRLDESHVGFYIADAVGHGMPAALLTMFVKRSLKTKEITDKGYRLISPSAAMAHLNDSLVEQNLSAATFATALYGVIDTRSLHLSYARGGHPDPILMTRDGEMRLFQADGGLLGIFPDETFTEAATTLSPGDRLFIFTDGIEVAFSADQTIDSAQWQHELFIRRHLSTADLLTDLASYLDHQSGSLAPKDDLTMIVAEVIEPATTA